MTTTALRHEASPVFGWLVFRIVRLLDRVLPPTALRAALLPIALPTALARSAKMSTGIGGMGFHREPCRARFRAALRHQLTRMLRMLPDRLIEPRWAERCTLVGAEHLLTAQSGAKPVVLAALHHGSLLVLRHWLRAKGHPVCSLVSEKAENRNALQRHQDGLLPHGHVPAVIGGRLPLEALRLLRNGGQLIVMMDQVLGKVIEAPVPGGVWRVSTTAFRLAAASDAPVLPVTIRETALWRFVIHIGAPIPAELIIDSTRHAEAAQQLWKEFLPALQESPSDCMTELVNSLHCHATEQNSSPAASERPCPTSA